MKLGAAPLAWLLLAPAASGAPGPPFKLRTEAKSSAFEPVESGPLHKP